MARKPQLEIQEKHIDKTARVINDNDLCIDGQMMPFKAKEFYSLNTLLAVAGTTGYCGGDSELSMMIDVLRFLADTLGKQAKAAERNWQPPNNTRRKDVDQK